jgi:hypothetical protein
MIDLSKIKPASRRALSSVLGLSLDGSRLEGVVLRRSNGALEIQQSFSVSLSLDLLTADSELVGREIRNHLDAAEVRERHCVVSLPLKWALTTQVDVPEIPEEDIAEFLQIEAERGFHADISTLHFAASRIRLPSGKQQALLVGVPKSQLQTLEDALTAARLKPLSFTLGITALQAPASEPATAVVTLAIGETQLALQVTGGGGVAALRALEGTLESESGKKILHAEAIARETRITLGQLPAELRETIKQIRIFGPRDLAQQLADALDLKLESMGLKTEVVSRYSEREFGAQLPIDTPVGMALSIAANRLIGRAPVFELLPPRVSAWQQVAARYSSGKLRMAGAAAGVVLLVLAGAFGFQQWRLSSYQSEWVAMAPKVKELEGISDQIHQFRPWYDDSMRALTILKRLTMAFPEDGSVSAKTIEIRDLNAVTCTGTTRDRQGVIKVFEGLRAAPGVSEIRMGNIRGNKPPMQFTFDFRWVEGARSEN